MTLNKENGQKQKTEIRRAPALLAFLAALALCGCSHSMINYQVADAIGTLGEYENNEPVETPKMRAQRESEEAWQAAQAVLDEQIAAADALAASYRYDEAIDYLKAITQDEPEYLEAHRLLRFLNFFQVYEDEDVIVNNSILREFIGGSVFFR